MDASCRRPPRSDRQGPLVIRPATRRDLTAVLALNEASVHVLAPLTARRLAELHRMASLHWVVTVSDEVVGFVLAFREGIEHDSVNYSWFAQRYASFLYVDRIVVGENARRRGAGSQMYARLFAHAAATGAELVTAEYDIDPPNPASARLHAKFGFREVGRQVVPYGMKAVSLQVAPTTRGRLRP